MSEGTVPAGYYKGRGIFGSQQYGVSANNNDQIVVDVDVPSLGRALSVFLSFSDKAAQYSIEKLRAMGWKGDDLTDLTGIDANEVDVSVKYEQYNGETKMKVDINAGGGRVKLESQMDERQKRAFAARMKAFIKGNGGGAPSRPAAPPTTRRHEGAYDPGPPADDDIPF